MLMREIQTEERNCAEIGTHSSLVKSQKELSLIMYFFLNDEIRFHQLSYRLLTVTENIIFTLYEQDLNKYNVGLK